MKQIVTIQGRLNPSLEEKQILDSLMRRFQSAVRYLYNRMCEAKSAAVKYELAKEARSKFDLPSLLMTNALHEASYLYRRFKGKRIIFGGKALFEKLKKKHLTGWRREELKKQWRLRRQGAISCMGVLGAGNRGFKIIHVKGPDFVCRVSYAPRQFIYVKMRSSHKRIPDFIQALKDGKPYKVRIIKKDDNLYHIFISFEIEFQEPHNEWIDNGIISFVFGNWRLVTASLKPDGNLSHFKKHNANNVFFGSSNKRNYYQWQLAHEIVRQAVEEEKAIAIPEFRRQTTNRGKTLNRIISFTPFRSFAEKVERVAQRSRVPVIKFKPRLDKKLVEQTSLVLKKDKSIATAVIIGRQAIKSLKPEA